MIARYEDWEFKLSEYLASVVNTPFSWGSNNCAFFVSGALEAMSGLKVTHWVDDKIENKFGALRECVKIGCKSIPEAEMKVLDETLTRQPLCQKLSYGDVVMANIDNLDPTALGPTAGIVAWDSAGILVPGRDGLELFELREKVVASWR